MWALIFIMAGVFFPIACSALDAEKAKQAMASELAQCAGYYMALSTLSLQPNNGDNTLPGSEKLQKSGERAMEIAGTYSANENQLGQIGGSAAELFIFSSNRPEWKKAKETYAKHCDSIITDPEARYKYWLSSADGKTK